MLRASLTAKALWELSIGACEPDLALQRPSSPWPHHLARLVYRMLRYGENYVEKGIEHYEEKFRLQRIKWLRKEARSLNFQLVLAQ